MVNIQWNNKQLHIQSVRCNYITIMSMCVMAYSIGTSLITLHDLYGLVHYYYITIVSVLWSIVKVLAFSFVTLYTSTRRVINIITNLITLI